MLESDVRAIFTNLYDAQKVVDTKRWLLNDRARLYDVDFQNWQLRVFIRENGQIPYVIVICPKLTLQDFEVLEREMGGRGVRSSSIRHYSLHLYKPISITKLGSFISFMNNL